MYSKEFCRTIANGRTPTDPEAARVIHWLLDALDETEVAALELKKQLELKAEPVGVARTWTLDKILAAAPELLPHSDQLCKGPNCNAALALVTFISRAWSLRDKRGTSSP